MEYAYAALILDESGEEINEHNLTAVLDAAGVSVEESRVKALVAALEDVDVGAIGGRAEALEAAGTTDSPELTDDERSDVAPVDGDGDGGDGGGTRPRTDDEAPGSDSTGGV